MIFVPYEDELEVINNIHKFNEEKYVVIRLTKTMIEKNNIDANVFLRDLLKKSNLVNYENLPHGGSEGIKYQAEFILENDMQPVMMNFYRVNNKRGDCRFSIYGINTLAKERKINEGDLLYVTINIKDKPVITIINTTRNSPKNEQLNYLFGNDRIDESLKRLIPLIRDIANQGYHKNSKGIGKLDPKDAGDTLESILGIQTNNSPKADFEDKIELKSKIGKSRDTLFTLRPQFENTPVEEIEKNDRSRVSAFTRFYGYESDKHVGYKNLYITIGSEDAPQNSIGFYLYVNEDCKTVELRKSVENNKYILTAFWTFENLEKELLQKHPATLWVKAKVRKNDDIVEFKYIEAELSRSPQFMTFLSLIKTGGVTYDWRGYTTPEGPYRGKNHGNAWRIKNKQRHLLFGSMEVIELI